jgi:hypothetical protein
VFRSEEKNWPQNAQEAQKTQREKNRPFLSFLVTLGGAFGFALCRDGDISNSLGTSFFCALCASCGEEFRLRGCEIQDLRFEKRRA